MMNHNKKDYYQKRLVYLNREINSLGDQIEGLRANRRHLSTLRTYVRRRLKCYTTIPVK